MTGPTYHGRTHIPGGTDPIPGFPTFRNTAVKYAMAGAEWKTASMYVSNGANVQATVDTTVPFGGYIEINGDGEYFVVGMPLGPKGSTWAINMGYHQTSDSGKVIFEWQTTDVDSNRGTAGYPEALEGPEWVSSTYYTDTGATSHQDFYAAAPADAYNSSYSPIVINGADGAMLSANGTATAPSPPYGGITSKLMNGGGDGGVYWWLRVRVNGKHASSSGYKARIYYLAVKRKEQTYGFDAF